MAPKKLRKRGNSRTKAAKRQPTRSPNAVTIVRRAAVPVGVADGEANAEDRAKTAIRAAPGRVAKAPEAGNPD
jgi:hypothetical protein